MQVEPIVNDVRTRGDAAVREYTAKFDKAQLDAVCVPIAELPEPDLPQDVTDAFDTAYANIRAFHEAQAAPELSVETMPGVVCRQVRTRAGRSPARHAPTASQRFRAFCRSAAPSMR